GVQTALEARSRTELKKAKNPVGAAQCETVGEGGIVRVQVMLQPQKCYSALAQSLPNITAVELTMKPNLGNPPNPALASLAPMLAQAQGNGPQATMGPGTNCWTSLVPLPIPAVVEAKAVGGTGPLAVQVYSD
ncbi:MAG: hypothetical protein AAGA56_01780, partial [Myxococcota bacterium]